MICTGIIKIKTFSKNDEFENVNKNMMYPVPYPTKIVLDLHGGKYRKLRSITKGPRG
jgi:hypothetical protein